MTALPDYVWSGPQAQGHTYKQELLLTLDIRQSPNAHVTSNMQANGLKTG